MNTNQSLTQESNMFKTISNLATTTGLVTLGVAIITTRTAVKVVKECKNVGKEYVDTMPHTYGGNESKQEEVVTDIPF